MRRTWRVYHPDLPDEGVEIELSSEEGRHVRQVLRLRPGDSLGVFDGRGAERAAVILESPGREVRVRLGPPLADSVEPPLDVHLYQALARAERIEWVVQKGTEIGLRSITLCRTARVDASEPSETRLARWRRIAREAAKQSGRRVVPPVDGPVELPDSPPGEGPGLLLVPGPDVPSLGARLEALEPCCTKLWLVVGPESGFDADESERLVRGGWERCNLGPRVLRTETAGPLAAALVLHRLGDLGPV